MGKKSNTGILVASFVAVAALAGVFRQPETKIPAVTATPVRVVAPATEEADLHRITVAPTATASSMRTNTPAPTRAPTATRRPANSATPAPMINSGANLRAGPGTNFAKIGGLASGEAASVIGRSSAGDWLQLADGSWIAAFLVDNVPASVPVAAVIPTAPPPTLTPIPPTATPSAPQPTACYGACCTLSPGARYGAICYDNTGSGATGRGACSHHGGVKEWLTCP